MRVLVTGGAGNLAKYCTDELRAHGHDVVLFDRFRPEDGKAPWTTDAELLLGDMTDRESCFGVFESARTEAMINLGGIPYATELPGPRQARIDRGETPPPEDETFKVNVLGGYYVLDAARRFGVRIVVHASSMATLTPKRPLPDGRVPIRTMPVDESYPLWAEDSYCLSKVLNEEMLLAFSRAYGMRAVALRMMHVYMPHGGADAPFNPKLGQPAKPPEPGSFAKWEYLDARDAAAAYRLAMEAGNLEPFEAMFVATDRLSTEEHRELVKRYYPHLAAQAERMGPDDLILSIRRARERLGYAPTHSWRGPEANARVN